MLARFSPVVEDQKKTAYTAAFVAFVAYIAIACIWVCDSFPGGAGYLFTSASVNGLVQILWFLLPSVWLVAFYKFGRLWLKIIAAIGLLFVGMSTIATTIWLFQSIVSNTDKYTTVIDISKIDENSNECLYRVEPLFPYGTGRIGRIEKKDFARNYLRQSKRKSQS
ncbi:MAG: hypothetical protein P4L53_06070 [Candidatus Obscuribacterales bacterium]|nr:hypothetical protein [Candidatus Obscuribacterales bacterium]